MRLERVNLIRPEFKSVRGEINLYVEGAISTVAASRRCVRGEVAGDRNGDNGDVATAHRVLFA